LIGATLSLSIIKMSWILLKRFFPHDSHFLFSSIPRSLTKDCDGACTCKFWALFKLFLKLFLSHFAHHCSYHLLVYFFLGILQKPGGIVALLDEAWYVTLIHAFQDNLHQNAKSSGCNSHLK
jgi:hypothetical protein